MQKLTPPATRWRMTDWLLVALALALVVFLIAPQQLPVSIYKLSLVSMAAVAGYWIDRSLFPYARPDGQLARYLLDPPPPIEVSVGDASAAQIDQAMKTGDYAAKPADCNGDDACLLAAEIDNGHVHLLIGAMLRRAMIVSSSILAVSLGA